jgi:hypothetical protein
MQPPELPRLPELPAAEDHALAEKRIGGELLFHGKFLTAWRDEVRLPDGSTASREYVTHPGAVVVVALLDDGRIVMERQYRYPVGRAMIELPAGKLERGEDPMWCAQRELPKKPATPRTNWRTPARCTWRLRIPPRSSTSALRAACAWASASSMRVNSWRCLPPRPPSCTTGCARAS